MSKSGGLLLLVCAGVALAVGGPTVVAESTASSNSCSDECQAHWSGPSGVDMQGSSDDFRKGGGTGTYIWHDGDGWHLRGYDPSHSHPDFRGSIVAVGGRVTVSHGVNTGSGDSVTSNSAGTTLTYSFHTTNGSKGVNFRVSGATMTFTVLNPDGSAADRTHIFLGDDRQIPPASSFSVTRDDEHASSSGTKSTSAPSTASGGSAGAPRRGSSRVGAGTHPTVHHTPHKGTATHPRR